MKKLIRLDSDSIDSCVLESDPDGSVRVTLTGPEGVVLDLHTRREEARKLGQGLLLIAGTVIEPLDDGDEMEDVEPPPGG